MAISADGRWAISGGERGIVRLWDLWRGEQCHAFVGHGMRVRVVAITPDGKIGVSGDDENVLFVWDLITRRVLDERRDALCETIAITPYGRQILTGGEGDVLRMWDWEKKLVCEFGRESRSARSVAIDAAARRAVSCHRDGSLIAWTLTNDRSRSRGTTRVMRSSKAAWQVAITPQGRRVVGAGAGYLGVWDLGSDTYREITTPYGHVGALSISHDGAIALPAYTACDKVELWDLEYLRPIRALTGHGGEVTSVGLTPDGRYAVSNSCGPDDFVCAWDICAGSTPESIEKHHDWVRSVAITEDGERAISGAAAAPHLLSWNLRTSRATRLAAATGDLTEVVAVTPDGRRAVSAEWSAKSGKLNIWAIDKVPGELRESIEGHPKGMTKVTLTGDGRFALSCGKDEYVVVYDLEWPKSSGRHLGAVVQWCTILP